MRPEMYQLSNQSSTGPTARCSTLERYTKRGASQKPRGVECRQRAIVGSDDQGYLCAAEHDGVAAFYFQPLGHFVKEETRLLEKDAVDEFFEDDRVDAFAIRFVGDLTRDVKLRELVGINRSLSQI